MDSLPIGDYALLSDCRSAVLVSRDGSVDWLCFPRFDAPSVFCRLLDPSGGRFAIQPAGEFRASRRYVDQTMVLETTFTTAGGTAVLTDALALGRNDRGHNLGAGSPGVLLRRLACTSGEIDAEGQLRPPAGVWTHPPVPGSGPRRAVRPGAALTGCYCPRRSVLTSAAIWRPAGSTWPPGSRPSSRSATARWLARRWSLGRRRRSPPGSMTPWRVSGPGRPSTRTTKGRGGSWCIIPAGCCRR
jgi:trehalase-like protein